MLHVCLSGIPSIVAVMDRWNWMIKGHKKYPLRSHKISRLTIILPANVCLSGISSIVAVMDETGCFMCAFLASPPLWR